MTSEKTRGLTEQELFVLREVQSYWGEQSTTEQVFFTELDAAAMFVEARDGSSPVMVVLTNLGTWYQEGTLSLEELRDQIKGPEGSSSGNDA